MGIAETDDPAAEFTFELRRSGVVLSGLAADLIESLPDDSYPGEDLGEVILEMITGTIRTVLVDAAEVDVRRAAARLRATPLILRVLTERESQAPPALSALDRPPDEQLRSGAACNVPIR